MVSLASRLEDLHQHLPNECLEHYFPINIGSEKKNLLNICNEM
jgi:hypothetical protein